MKRALALFGTVALLSSSCALVKGTAVRDDWASTDAPRVKRLAIVVYPTPQNLTAAGEAVARIARRYVNQKRDFLAKREVTEPDAPALSVVCAGDDAIEGVLFLRPTFTPKGSGFEVEVHGALARCSDGREAWSGLAAGSFPSHDAGLKEVTQVYVQEFGAPVEPYIAPALNILRPLLDTLPQPTLNETDVEEKLTLD